MRELLSELLTGVDLQRHVGIFFLVLARWIPLTVLAPIFAARSMPASARLGLGGALSLLVYGAAQSAAGPLPDSGMALALLVVREVLIGSVLGLVVAIPFLALEAAGRLVDSARGARMAELMAAPTGVRTSPTGGFLLLLGVVLFLMVDGHLLVLSAVAHSYRSLPVSTALAPDAPARVAPLVVYLGSELLAVALGIAAPVLAATVLLDLSLGIAGRLAPRLPLYFLGLPLKGLGGVAVLALSLSVMLLYLGGLFRLTLRALDATLSALGAG